MDLLEYSRWLEDTWWATAIRESGYVYPFVEGSHVMALAFSVGAVLWFDLRLLGLTMREDRVSDVFNQVRPWMFAGFTVMFVTGVLLFAARATDAYASPYFRLKLALLVLGGVNIVLFHTTIDRQRDQWDAAGRPPARARLAGGVSLALWFAIIAVGRVMAYNL
jgi:hypothetical protein